MAFSMVERLHAQKKAPSSILPRFAGEDAPALGFG